MLLPDGFCGSWRKFLKIMDKLDKIILKSDYGLLKK